MIMALYKCFTDIFFNDLYKIEKNYYKVLRLTELTVFVHVSGIRFSWWIYPCVSVAVVGGFIRVL